MINEAPASVESAAVVWVKSSYSGGEGGECVEMAHSPTAVYVRDSKDRQGARLTFGSSEWSEFIRFAARS
jgi:hypothetical protein